MNPVEQIDNLLAHVEGINDERDSVPILLAIRKLWPQVNKSMSRKYLPTLSELIDRLSIVQLKAIFIGEHRDAYKEEIALIEHDIDLLLGERPDYRICAKDIRAILAVMLTNRFIWENESKARAGGPEQDHLLKLTHSVNGQRNTAKNILSRSFGERMDMKIDALAAELPSDLGHWDIFK